jgi:hypothetical protein
MTASFSSVNVAAEFVRSHFVAFFIDSSSAVGLDGVNWRLSRDFRDDASVLFGINISASSNTGG